MHSFVLFSFIYNIGICLLSLPFIGVINPTMHRLQVELNFYING